MAHHDHFDELERSFLGEDAPEPHVWLEVGFVVFAVAIILAGLATAGLYAAGVILK